MRVCIDRNLLNYCVSSTVIVKVKLRGGFMNDSVFGGKIIAVIIKIAAEQKIKFFNSMVVSLMLFGLETVLITKKE